MLSNQAMKILSRVCWALFLFVLSVALKDLIFPPGRCPGCIDFSGMLIGALALLAFVVQFIGVLIALGMSLARGAKGQIRSNLVLLLCNLSLAGWVTHIVLRDRRNDERLRVESAKYSESQALAWDLIRYFYDWCATAAPLTPTRDGSELIVPNDFKAYCESIEKCNALIRIKDGVIVDTRDRSILFAVDVNMDGRINDGGLDRQYVFNYTPTEKVRVAILIDAPPSNERYTGPVNQRYQPIYFYEDNYR